MSTVAGKSEEVIERWMLKITTDGGIDRFDDLHIERIDPNWKEKNTWIEKSFEAFHIAVGIRNRNNMPYSICLSFSLHSSEVLTGINFRTQEELLDQLDCSSPSLYLFRRRDEPHTQSKSANVQALNPAILGVVDGTRCYYMEFKQQNGEEYSRSVFVEG